MTIVCVRLFGKLEENITFCPKDKKKISKNKNKIKQKVFCRMFLEN